MAAASLLTLLLGCGEPRPCYESGDAELLAIGDSIQAWYASDCGAVADHAGRALGLTVRNQAVSGAHLTGDDAIADQVPAGDFGWVLLNGGANDVNGECDCAVEGDCAGVLDALVSADGASGELPALLDRLTGAGHRVALLRYYPPLPDAGFGFDQCLAELEVLRQRQAAAADRRAGAWLVDPDPLVDAELYASDGIHPSKEGARRLGELTAEVISSAH